MALRMRTPLPDLSGVPNWINGTIDQEALAGKPLLVHFWSISCYMCHDTAQQIAQWHLKYSPQGLVVLSVHQPRGPEELDVTSVTADAQGAMHMSWPCAIDNTHTLVDRFGNEFVPAYYVFNREHEMRHFQAGDKGYDRIEAAIERVL
jgi:thiol-disulfide isomerase/thioredoxin